MKAVIRSLLALLLLLSPALLPAQGNNIFVVVPDGRIETDSIPPNMGTTYVFSTMQGHSYSVEQSRGLLSPTIQMWVGPTCPGPFGMTLVDTSLMDPSVTLNLGFGQQRQRLAFVCPGPIYPSPNNPPGQASATIFNSGPNPYTFSLSVVDTTLFSPKWKAGPDSDTFWTFTNTSSAPVNIWVNLVDANGSSVYLPNPGPNPITIPPGATYSTDTTQIPPFLRNMPPNGAPLSGSVVAGENGPPGAILATAVIVTNSGGPAPSTETVKFEPRQ